MKIRTVKAEDILSDPPVPSEDEIDLVLARLFFADNDAWRIMLGLRNQRDLLRKVAP